MKQNYRITDIQIKSNHSNRVQLFLDYQLFMEIDETVIKELDLYIGKTVTDGLLEVIQQKENQSKAKNDAIRFLAVRPRSEYEISNKLKSKDYHHHIIEKTIDWLKEKNLVNDQEFSEMWINDRINHKPSGVIKLRQELHHKGIDSEIIENTIHFFFKTEEDELSLAYRLIQSKKNSLSAKNIELDSRKVINLLKSRGFSYHTIHQICQEFFDE